jgi:glycosyltransferase involved in cell wall biosynthesis
VVVYLVLEALYRLQPGFDPAVIPYDVRVYYDAASSVISGHWPYRDFFFPYPPGSLLFFVPPRLLASDCYTFLVQFKIELLVLSMVGVVAAAWVAQRLGQPLGTTLLLYSCALPVLGSIVPQRYDLAPAILVLVAATACLRRWRIVTWVLLALGTLSKVYPVVLLPLFSSLEWRAYGWRSVLRGWLTLVCLIVVGLLPFMVAAPQQTVKVFGAQAGRGLEIESTLALVLLAARHLGLPAAAVYNEYLNTWEVTSPYGQVLQLALLPLQGCLLLLLWARFHRLPQAGLRDLMRYSAATLAVALLTSKVFSPQFMIWLFPLPILIGTRRVWATSGPFLVAMLLTHLANPFLWVPLKQGDSLAVLVLLLRDAMLLLLALTLVAHRRVDSPERCAQACDRDMRKPRPLRVTVLAHVFPRGLNDPMGAFLLHLALGLDAQGVAVDVIAPHAPGLAYCEILAGIRVHRFRYAPDRWERLAYSGTMHEAVASGCANKLLFVLFSLAMFWSGLSVALRTRADLIHAHWWAPGGLVGALISSLTGRPLVLTTHGTDVEILSHANWIVLLARRVFGRAQVATCGSGYLRAQLIALGVGSVRVRVIPMPVSRLFEACAEGFTSSDHRREEKARESCTVLTVARLTAQKDIATLLEALSLLRERGRAIRLIVVGDGPQRGSLESRAASLGLANDVEFRGTVAPQYLPAIYRSCDVFVLPSVGEGLGLVLVEALLCGKPVVATSGGGATDVVTDDETGLLVPQRSALALADAIERLCDNPALAARLAASGKARAQQRFTSDAIAAQFLEVYRSLTQNGPAY